MEAMDNIENKDNVVSVLEYNTHREKLTLPEYGRLVQKMVEQVKSIQDREKRSQQARAVVRTMELLNPSIHQQENWERTLWDNLFVMADYDLDIDSPYPKPQKSDIHETPQTVPVEKKPLKAMHYGRNILNVIDLVSGLEDGELKTQMIHDLAVYMRTQYLIWNKDSVSDATIFQDIEKLSEGRLVVPEGMVLTELSKKASFNRPGLNPSQKNNNNNKGRNKGNRGNNQRKGGRR